MYRILSFVVTALISFISLCNSTFLPHGRYVPGPKVNTRAAIPEDGHWVDTWTAMPQLTEYMNLPPPPFVSRCLYGPYSRL